MNLGYPQNDDLFRKLGVDVTTATDKEALYNALTCVAVG